MANGFSRSIVAQAVALAMVETARKSGGVKGAMIALPVLAEAEKELFLKILARLEERRKGGNAALSDDELASLFTFVYAKAAEAVTNLVNGQPNNFELLGMFDGKIPLYADEQLTGYFRRLDLATRCAQAYADWHVANASLESLQTCDPVLPLCEALKWCFRMSCTAAIEKLEADGKAVPGV